MSVDEAVVVIRLFFFIFKRLKDFANVLIRELWQIRESSARVSTAQRKSRLASCGENVDEGSERTGVSYIGFMPSPVLAGRI